MTTNLVNDGLRHYAPPSLSQFSPCGKRIGRGLDDETPIHSCAHDPQKVTCPECIKLMFQPLSRQRHNALFTAAQVEKIGAATWGYSTLRWLEREGFLEKVQDTHGYYKITDAGRARVAK